MANQEKEKVQENDLAFQARRFAEAKMRAEDIGRAQRQAFEDMQRMTALMAQGGVALPNECITFEDEVDQAAWDKYAGPPEGLKGDPPIPWTDAEIEGRAMALIEGGARR